jgi:serine/threonine protein kinase/tetratricopeptide (TPR) repeat protein
LTLNLSPFVDLFPASNLTCAEMVDSTSLIGQTISHYRILEKLGEGGMGVVYRAYDEQLNRDVAFKVLPADLLRDPKARARLRREAQTAAALNHPNVCSVYEVSEADGVLYIAMEFVKGKTLRDLGAGGLPIDIWFKYAAQIAEGLAHAHSLGILHRDIKTSNVMISADGRAKVVDFGLAKRLQESDQGVTRSSLTLDKPGEFVGTLPYAAPEILQGQSADSRSDVWSLGILLFEMLTGTRPFTGRTAYEITSAILNRGPEPIPASAPPGVKAVIQRCLRKLPSERFQQGGEVRAALEVAVSNPDQETTQERADHKSYIPAGTKWMIAVGAVLLAVVIWLGYRYTLNRRTTPKEGQLAVLPMSMSETDPAMSAFGKGLVETLTARLTQLTQKHAIQVIPASAIQSKSIATVEQARKEFGANLGLELNLQRSGDEIRINFNLIDANSMLQLGAGTVTGKSADTFNVEDKVCEGVANALEIQLQPTEKRALLANRTSEPSAYDFYVQGRGYLKSFNRPESFEGAISVFNHALELDQNYGPAFAGLGQAYWNEYELTKDEKWITRAKYACQRAVELNRTRPDGHACLGSILNGTGQYEQALEQFQEAIQLDPSDDNPYIGLATTYEKLGKTQEAEVTYKRAIQLRPSYPLAYNRLGEFQMAHGQYQDAAEMFKQVIALAPDNFAGYSNLGIAYLQQNRYTEAVPMLERSIVLRRTAETLSNLGTAYFQLRRFVDAARVYEEAVRVDEHNYEVWGNLGDAYYWSPELRSKAPSAYEKASSLALAKLAVNPRDVDALGYVAEYQAMLGRRKESMMYLDRCLRLNPQDPALLFNTALIYNTFGEEEAALAWLQKAIAAGMPRSALRESPNFDSLQGNSRFLQLANEGNHK